MIPAAASTASPPSDAVARRRTAPTAGAPPSSLDRLAETIKNLLLDWDWQGDESEAVLVEELPPMCRETFALRLRERMEETLRQMADAINAAPTGNIVAASAEAVRAVLADFGTAAVELGVRLRIDAAEAALPLAPLPQGEWARKLRLMQTGSPDLSPPSGNGGLQS